MSEPSSNAHADSATRRQYSVRLATNTVVAKPKRRCGDIAYGITRRQRTANGLPFDSALPAMAYGSLSVMAFAVEDGSPPEFFDPSPGNAIGPAFNTGVGPDRSSCQTVACWLPLLLLQL